MKFHRIHTHLRQHHKKYIGWLFAWFALIKTFVLLTGFLGIINFASIFAWDTELNSGNLVSIYWCAVDTTICDLSEQGITSIAPNTFINHSNLQLLRLSHNEISSLASWTFNGLNSLLQLYLHYNAITTIDTGAFNGLPSLDYLNLANNLLVNIPPTEEAKINTISTWSLVLNQNCWNAASMNTDFINFLNAKANTSTWQTSISSSCPANIFGCTNPGSPNYNPDAYLDDESCMSEEDGSIITTYFWSWSTYTTNRTGNSCDTETMHVEYINPGTDQIPENLSGDTIYVLLAWSHITSRTINLATCSAIVGSGNVTLYSSVSLDPAIFYAYNKQHIIIDHIKLDGNRDGNGGSHANTNDGMLFEENINNSTINNVQIYDFEYYWFLMRYSGHNNTFNKVQAYNNTYGLSFDRSTRDNVIENTQVYNNSSIWIFMQNSSNNNNLNNVQAYNNENGIYLYNSSNTTINNSQAYNNTYGIFFINPTSQYNTINHCQLFSNVYGIEINNSSFNAINDTQLYNNSYWIDTNTASNVYYGVLKTFANGTHFTDEPVTAWTESEFLSWWTRSTTWSMSCDRVTNPMNSDGVFLAVEDGCLQKWKISSRSGHDIGYLYWSNIIAQTQALQDNGTWASVYAWSTLDWDPSKYIAEYNRLISGSFVVASGRPYVTGNNIQIQLMAAEEVDYMLFGDFEESPLVGTLSGMETKDVIVTTWYTAKHISVTYSTGDRERTLNKTINYIDPNGLPYIYFWSWNNYTQHWTGNTCNPGEISVVSVDPWINTIPHYLTENTIYIVNSWAYTTTDDYIHPSHCSALIGSGDVTIYSDWYFNRILFFTEATNNIVDNIHVDGIGDENGGSHGRNFAGIQIYMSSNNTIINSSAFNNQNGIKLESSANNTTMSNDRTYDNSNAWFIISNSTNNVITSSQAYNNMQGINLIEASNTTVTDSQLYDNTNGFYCDGSNSNTLSDSQVYNNWSKGIYFYSSANNVVNNVHSYNNTDQGIYLLFSSNTTVNNSQLYNNGIEGILLYQSPNTTIYNSQLYNNLYGINFTYSNNLSIVDSQFYNNNEWIYAYPNWSFNDKYYWTIKLFANDSNTNVNGQLSAWEDTAFFSWGVLEENTETMSCDWTTNPMNMDELFLVDEDQYSTCNRRWRNSERSGNQISYLYGANILHQAHVLQDSGTFSWSNDFDPTKYIAETNVLLNWSLLLASGQTYTFDTGISAQLTLPEPADYVLTGDFEGSPMTGTLTDTETKNITLTTWYGTKHISVTYSTGDRERTINKTISYVDPAWLPFTYFWSGSAYTTNRSGNSCNPALMSVEYIDPGTDNIPAELTGNTIYILLSWAHITSRPIYLATCSALIGSGDVVFSANTYVDQLIRSESKENMIVDNIAIDGTYDNWNGRNPYDLSLSSSSNITLNSIHVYNSSYAIFLYASSHATISNSQIYNNYNYGIYLYENANNNTIHNIQSYNNSVWIWISYNSSNNTINNTQTYNNSNAGIAIQNSSNTTIHNSQSYNNYYWGAYIWDGSSNGLINNFEAYNNGYNDGEGNQGGWIYSTDATMMYYGTLRLFANNINIGDTAPTAWSDSEFFSWWVLDEQGTMSCDWATNPVNSEWVPLMQDGDYPNCDLKWINQEREATSTTKYLYWSNILKQTQAIKDTATGNPSVFSLSDMFFDSTKYIAEINPTLNGSLLLAAGQSYVVESGIQIQLSTNEYVDYVLTGDFVWAPITGTLYGTVTGMVSLTTWYTLKHISVTYSTGGKERVVNKSIGYISSIENYCELVTDLTREQCDAIVALYIDTNGSGWSDKTNRLGVWDTTPTTACDRYWVSCNPNDGEVTSIYEIDLEENNLSGVIPVQMSGLIDIRYLYLGDNQIAGIETWAFAWENNLAELALDNNHLTNIASGMFNGLSSLAYLYINNNLITDIGDGAFNGMSNLTILNLENNHIATIASGAFNDLSSLSQMYLHNNMLTGIDDTTFRGLSNLNLLYLSNNQIATIASGAFNDLVNCRNLFINNNQIESISSDTFSGLSNIEELSLRNNRLTSLVSGTFSEMPTLWYLYLNDNQITSIAVDAFNGMSNIEQLDLYNNLIATITSGSFNGLSQLSYLDLYNNQIAIIPAGAFNGIPNLNTLYINNNRISSIAPNAFDGTPDLYSLYMVYNEITAIASGAFNGLSNIGQLGLGNNLISDIKDISFHWLSSLWYLGLANNLITSISSGSFDELLSCNNLELSNNLISSVATGAFEELPSLQYLYLRYNQIGWSLDIFCPFTNLVYLFVDHNRFEGDIPSCLTELTNVADRWGWDISYNYLNMDVEYSQELLDYLQSNYRFWRYRNVQYLVSDLVLSWTILSLEDNAFTLNLWYQNNWPKTANNISIQYDMLDGMDIVADAEFTTWKVGVTYGGVSDPCFVDMYDNGSGTYFDLMEAYAEDEGYDNLADMLCSREGLYCGDNSGAGKARADYIIDDYDGDPVDREYEFEDDFDMYLNELSSCGTGGKDVYTFDIGNLDVWQSGNIIITWTFSDDLKDDGFSNFTEISSANSMRIDGHIRNNRFWFTYSDNTITIDEMTSLFTDLPDDAAIITWDIALSDVGANTGGISFRSENIEVYLPPRVHITTSWAVCDVATLLIPQDKTAEIKAIDSTITAAFQIWSACSGTTLLFNTPIRIRMYIPTVLGDINTFKISRDGIYRENVSWNKIDDHLVEIETSHFSYFTITTSNTVITPPSNPSPWPSGWPWPVKDICPAQRDCSDSYYDRLCGPCPIIDQKIVKKIDNALCSIEKSKFSTELNGAYQRACSYDITTMPTIQKANMEGKLLRKDMAKMISNFAINIMDKNISTGVTCEFTDMRTLSKEAQYYAIAACRLWLMWYESDGMTTKHTFDPNEEVDRAQFGTILSRLLRGDENNSKAIYYEKHLKALKQAGIMTKIDKPLSKELRWYVMLMMMRANK